MRELSSRPDGDAAPDVIAATDRRLRQLVAFNVRADSALIEDACQTAWLRLTRSGLALSPGARLSWLVTTATREALRLVRAHQAELPLDAPEAGPLASCAPGPAVVAEQRCQLGIVQSLNARQRRLIWLQGLGFSYQEMADREQASLRTVERQVLRARGRLRAAAAQG
ncbi:MAG TPA: sigma-70 family RNA polymerase sigma factor [Solirubrobacteraceae bacterium]|nr:sigma-70 family RNA polymerase sigma factor [Solirubrobacteraceae bacterium]